MKSSIRTSVLAFCALLAAACDRGENEPGATGPDVTGKIRGRLLLAGGRPAPDAVVKVYAVNYAPWTAAAAKRGATGLGKSARRVAAPGPAFVARTDAEGYYVLDSLERGEYNLLGEKDGLASLQDSVFLSGSQSEIDPDTLLEAGLVQGTVRLQPNHSLETVTLQALGTHVYANADAEGRFALGPLPRGHYRVRVTTTEGQYTVLHQDMEVFPRRRDTLSDTLKPSYTGIPVVTGLRASYDTLAGTATVTWNRARYPQLQAYHLFRSRAGDLALPSQPIAIVTDTFYRDAIFPTGGDGVDTATSEYHYRVKVVNLSDIPGHAFGFVAVKAPPPSRASTRLDIDIYNHTAATAAVGGEVSVGDSVRLNLSFLNPGRRITRVEWFRFNESNPPLHALELDPPAFEGMSSLAVSAGREAGPETYLVRATDASGKVWRATTTLQVRSDLPSVDAGEDVEVPRKGRVALAPQGRDRFGRIVKWEWDIGATGRFVEVKGGDTAFTATDTLVTLPCVVRVTDDDGGSATDTVNVKTVLRWRMVDPTFSPSAKPPYYGHRTVAFAGALWALGGETYNPNWTLSDFYPLNFRAGDGKSWLEVDSTRTFNNRYGHGVAVFKDRLWVFGGFIKEHNGNHQLRRLAGDVWSSVDGVSWDRETPDGFPKLDGFEVVVFRNRLWAVGGIDSAGSASGVWSSGDGITWTREVSASPPPGTVGHALVVQGDRILLIGGLDVRNRFARNDIWSSVNGREWEQETSDGRFAPRHGHSVVSLEGRLYLLGGTGDGLPQSRYFGYPGYVAMPRYSAKADVWHSGDGKRWFRAEHADLPSPRSLTWAAAFQGGIWILHGGTEFQTHPKVDSWVLE